jgi:hypothetical protein
MEQNRSLVSIVKDFNALDELLIEQSGELCPTLENWMQINEHNLAEKVDNYKLYIEHLESRNEYFKGIKDQANQAQNIFKNMVSRMKENLKFSMSNLGSDELRGDMYRFKLSKPKQKVQIVNSEEIPLEFTKEVTRIEIDMDKIDAAISAGQKIPGVGIETSQSLLSYSNTKGK